MKVALVGLPQSGKSTVFAAVTGQTVDPYAAPGPRQAVVRVPDERLAFLTQLCQPKKVIEATLDLIDVPGCSLDDSRGQDEWRRLLPTVRVADLLVVVVRDFKNDAVPCYQDRLDAAKDFALVWDELIFADLDGVTTRIERLEKALTKPTKTRDAEKRELAILQTCREALENEKPLSTVLTSDEDRRTVASFAFLTEKPLICVRNVSDDQAATAKPLDLPHVAESLTLSASIEADIAQLDDEDRPAFLAEMNISEPAGDRLIRACYRAGGLISFLTMGPDEVRAWTIPNGATAQEAAGKIHTDLARGFIRAETVGFDDLVANEDMKGAKAAGKVRKEGKSYIVIDGDVLVILANP